MIETVAKRVSNIVSALGSAGAVIAGLAVVLITLLIAAEIISRGVFNHALLDVVTFARIAMGVIGFLGAAYTLRKGKHISIELVINHLPEQLARGVKIAASIIGLFCLAVIVWLSFEFAWFSRVHDLRWAGLISFPTYLPQMLIPIGFGMIALQLLVMIVAGIRAMFKEMPRADKHEAA